MNRFTTFVRVAAVASQIGAVASFAGESVFEDGLEIGSVCRWTVTAPAVECDEYQTCEKASNDHWACFEMPHLAGAEPTEAAGAGEPATVTKADVYILLDRSGSMATEISTIKDNIAAAIDAMQCPPHGTGTPGTCWQELWAGAGTIGYAGFSSTAYQNWLDVRTDPNFIGVLITEPSTGNGTQEGSMLAIWAAATGQSSASSGCTNADDFLAKSCASSPAATAGEGGHGYPCFRDTALPIFVVVTDEGPITGSDTLHCPDSTTVTDAAKAIGAKIIGIYGDLPPGSTAVADLTTLATATGAVDSSNAAAPMVYSGSGSGADDAIVAALQTARTSMPLEDVHAVVVDVEGDAVDVATFVDRVEVAADFDEEACEQGLETSDQTPDGFDDTYDSVPGSSVLCWRIVAAGNTDVPGDVAARNYPGTLRVLSGNAILQELPLLFIVPPG